jgi:hypothetical protein
VKAKRALPTIFVMKDKSLVVGHDAVVHGQSVLTVPPGELFGFNTGDWKTSTLADVESPHLT